MQFYTLCGSFKTLPTALFLVSNRSKLFAAFSVSLHNEIYSIEGMLNLRHLQGSIVLAELGALSTLWWLVNFMPLTFNFPPQFITSVCRS